MASAPVQQATVQVRAQAPPALVRRSRASASVLPWVALAAVVAFGVVQTAIRFHHYHLGLLGDDYDFLLSREGLSVHAILAPHNENLSALPVLLYRAIFAFVGVSTAVPYIALLLLSLCACAVLAYVFVRRELGPWIALAAPLVLVTLGPAAEALLWPFEFTLLGALALWLGAMLVMQRGRTRSDAVACVLLVLALSTQSIAVALVPASAVALLLWRGWRKAWRSAWIVGVPLALYLAWYLAYKPQLERTLTTVPHFIVDSFVAAVADISGIGNWSVDVALAALLLVAVCARCVHLRRVPATTIYMSLGLLLIWIAAGLSEGPGRVPSESRYQFHNSLLLMLALAPLVPRPRARPLRWMLARGALLGAVVVAIAVANMGRYGTWEEAFVYQQSLANAELAALQVARPAVTTPNQTFTTENEPGLFWPFTPRAYFNAIDAHGSPVSVQRNLVAASPSARSMADRVLVRVEGISLQVGVPASPGTVVPRAESGTPLRPAGSGCAVLPAGAAREGDDVIAPGAGGLIIRPHAGPALSVGVGRFSDPPFAVRLGSLAGAEEGVIHTNPDASSVAWRFLITAQQTVTLCSLAR